jgi:hypothetical protein
MLSRRLPGVALAALFVLIAAACASAAVPSTKVTPILIGDGYNATVTVDAAGTAYIAYDGNEPTENSLHFCRLPRGATACASKPTLTTTQTSLEHPLVVVNGSTVQVVSYRYGFSNPFSQDIVFTSHDGGANFDGGVSVGQNPFYLAIPGPGNTVSTITDADSSDGGTIYQRLPLDGSSAGNTRANLSTTHLYEGALALLDPNTLLATMADASDNAFWRRSSGSGDPNDAATWTPEQPIGVARSPHFAYGSSGVFLIAGVNGALTSRKWNGAGFAAPVTIPGGDGEVPQSFATEDGGGRIHALLPQITANGSQLLYATSDDGVCWDARQFAFEPLAAQTQIAAAPDHLGVAVWNASPGSARQVFALPIGPSAALPVLSKSVGISVVSGVVQIKTPCNGSFTTFSGETAIPVGSVIDATHGRVRITIVEPGGRQQSADFYDGVFKVTEAKNGLATMSLQGGRFGRCGGRGARVGSAAKAKVIRQLWGSGSGKFRTRGRFATATVRGTKWDTVDRCDGTLVKVTAGSAAVTDLVRHKTVFVKKGHSYLARR